ncbi:MAG: DEAD/DEAH box helicase [Flavobacteriales bacterium]
MTFNQLGLSEPILKAIQKKAYDTPSPIQEKAIPPVLEGNDVLASAQTGTGKTAGFTLPLLHILTKRPQRKSRVIRALILTPTRELAAQVFDNVKDYSQFLDIKSTVIFGGVNQNPQVKQIRQGIDVLVATPGRLLDLESQGLLSLRHVEIFVLDEADRMLDMGFQRDIQRVLKLIPKKRQTLLFSATFSKDIKKLAHQLLSNPIQVEATPENTTVEAISQKVFRVAKAQKTAYIIKLIKEGNWTQVLVFTRTKHGANNLTKKMLSSNISAAAIHGNKSQNARTKALSGFKQGNIRVLVATDIAARGLDIPLLPHVVNYELPNVPEDYVHRIGRTGRAGAQGEALSLVCTEELSYLKSIEKLVNLKIKTETPVGFEPDPDESTAPPKQGGGRQKKGGSKSSRSNTSRNTTSRRRSR